MAEASFEEFKLVEEITVEIWLIISKWAESMRAHLPQPIQRSGKTLNFCNKLGLEAAWSTFFWLEELEVLVVDKIFEEELEFWLVEEVTKAIMVPLNKNSGRVIFLRDMVNIINISLKVAEDYNLKINPQFLEGLKK